MADLDVLPPGAAGGPASPGEDAWRELVASIQPLEPPASWETNPPSPKDAAAFERQQGEHAVSIARKLQDYYTRFPTNSHAAGAREQEYDLLNLAAKAGVTNAFARLETLEAERLNDTNLADDDRLQVRIEQIQRMAAQAGDDKTAAMAALEKGARALQKEFPKRPELAGMLVAVAEGYLAAGDLKKSRTLAEEIVQGDGDAELKAGAEGLLNRIDRVGKPVALAFTAIDGREVDLAKLKGKVVLVDFWATWCMPCLAELPNVKAAYEKHHAQGFEIIGVSFDSRKEELERLVAREQISWPQYFESGGDDHKFAKAFQISSIPTMWLVDKQGNLRELNARDDLAAKVARLLAEK